MMRTLRARLILFYIGVFGLLLVALSVASYRVLARRLDADASARLTELADGLHGYLRFDNDPPTVAFDETDPDEATFVHEATRYYQLYQADTGRLLIQSDGLQPLGLHFTPTEVQAFRAEPPFFDVRTDYGRFRIANSLIARPSGQTYLLQVGASLATMDGALGRYLDLLLWLTPLSLAVTAIVAWWLAGLALAPLAKVAVTARGIGIDNLQRRLPVRGTGDELDTVATTFNDTLARLEHAVGEMRQFSAALAHELRTPLSALRGEIELALGSPDVSDAHGRRFSSQLEEIDRLKRLIDQVLTLARADTGQIPLAFAPVDVGALGRSLVDQLEPIALARAVDLRCECASAVMVNGDAGWLERLVLNLLDNALKFTGEGGRVRLRVTRHEDGARLEVSDTGIGMAPETLPHVFERFFRADPARSSGVEGAGLGLSLVTWIVDRHDGRIDVTSRPGEGSTFTVWLPR